MKVIVRGRKTQEVLDYIDTLEYSDLREDLKNVFQEWMFRGDIEHDVSGVRVVDLDYGDFKVEVEVMFYGDVLEFDVEKVLIKEVI